MISLRKDYVDRVVARVGTFSDDHNRNLSLRNEYGRVELNEVPKDNYATWALKWSPIRKF